MSGQVTAVTYGNEVHLYPAGDWRAESVYLVAIGSNLDAGLFTLTAEGWEKARDKIRRDIPEGRVFDHR